MVASAKSVRGAELRRAMRPKRKRRVTPAWVYRQLVNRYGDPAEINTNSAYTTPPAFITSGRRTQLGTTNLDARLGRDMNAECGYEDKPEFEYYREMYDRVGPAHRAVNIWPDECWGAYPDLYETSKKGQTPFEKAWLDLAVRTNPWHYCHRVDRLSRIGAYGALFLGFDGDANLTTPGVQYNTDGTVRTNAQPRKLLYLRAFDQQQAKIKQTEGRFNSPRYGLPTYYELQTTAPTGVPQISGAEVTRPVIVHWTRVIHIADNREASEVFGVPALRPVINLLYDIRKVMGSAAEMFWKGGFPGYAFQTDPDLTGEAAIDEDAIRDEVAAYVAGLQRYLTAVGGKWSSLAPQVSSPKGHLEMLFTLLCSTLGVPMRIMFGSESGHLASTQDSGTWKERLSARQRNYCEPMIARPLVDRLVDAGSLPRPEKYIIEWRDLRTLGEKDRAEVFLKQTQGLMQYVTGQVGTVFPLRQALSILMGLTDEQVTAVIDAVGENPKPPVPPPAPALAGGNQAGRAPRSAARAGRPAGPPRSNK